MSYIAHCILAIAIYSQGMVFSIRCCLLSPIYTAIENIKHVTYISLNLSSFVNVFTTFFIVFFIVFIVLYLPISSGCLLNQPKL